MWLSEFEIVLRDRIIPSGAIRIENGRIAGGLAEEVHPTHPVGVYELLHARHLAPADPAARTGTVLLLRSGDDHRAVRVADDVVGDRAQQCALDTAATA